MPKTGDKMIDAYLARTTAAISRRFLDGATTRAAWEKRRPRLHHEYLDMLGLWPLPEKTPLQAKVTGTLQRDNFVVEKLHFQSRPGLYVTANLYRPRTTKSKLPAVLYLCGHSGRGRNGNKTAFQDHGMWFATHGYICLIIDTLQLGEIPGIHHGTYNLGRWWWQARGYTPAGVECWNGIRAIDYLVSRPNVDRNRIAVTTTATEARESASNEKEEEKARRKRESEIKDETALLNAIDRLAKKADKVAGYTQARELSGLSGPRMAQAVARLTDAGFIIETDFKVKCGNNATKPCKGLKRRGPGDPKSEHPSGRSDGLTDVPDG
jgi:hypothetical protein